MKRRVKGSFPIFHIILMAVGALVAVEILLLIGFLWGSRITDKLDRNACDILHEKVVNRRDYLQNEMVGRWSNLSLAVEAVNGKTEKLLRTGKLKVSELTVNSPSCARLLEEMARELTALIRNNAVTGAYVVLGTKEPDASQPVDRPGLYIRDMDPSSVPSYADEDLLLERGPVSVVQSLGIPTDTCWQPAFRFEEDGYDDFYYKPFVYALQHGKSGMQSLDMGYWGKSFRLKGDDKDVITYSVPLFLKDGTVYGILGVDILQNYLAGQLPYEELTESKRGSYVLIHGESAQRTTDGGLKAYREVMSSGKVFDQYAQKNSSLQLLSEDDSVSRVLIDGADRKLLCDVQPLKLYNADSHFAGEEWGLMGTVRREDLFAFSGSIMTVFLIMTAMIALTGIGGCYFISYVVSHPITALVKKVKAADPLMSLQLPPSGILEIDGLLSSIEKLNTDVRTASARFSMIMEMASVKIAGFEVNTEERSLFITGRFFEIFGRPEADRRHMTVELFRQNMEELQQYLIEDKREEHKLLFRIPQEERFIYVSLNYLSSKERYIGLSEDVTAAMLDMERLEHERDHDVLTGLKNRRAFQRIMGELLEGDRKNLKTAALLMIDLDNLKFLNDTYGHDCGDRYIKAAADCFVGNAPSGVLVSRVSGDEFYLFYYGYPDREEILKRIGELQTAVRSGVVRLPNGQTSGLQVSGGIAWYPEDGQTVEELVKHSDFAMYCVKNSGKGRFDFFNKEAYLREKELLENKAELIEIIENKNVYYCLQPIVDVTSGEIFAYEALMRSGLPTLNSPDKILALARLESRLNQIEELTWFKAMETFVCHVENGRVAKESRIFINSIANQCMSHDQSEEFERLYGNYLSNVVLEVTENEPQDKINHQYKVDRVLHRWNGAVALDDYGSGYNSETTLLTLNPRYIKVDLSIIRDIDTDSDKQKVVENIVSYAHERDMRIIAEGIETEAEMEMTVRLGVDYLQGYYLGRPVRDPAPIEETVAQRLRGISLAKRP